MQTALPHAAGIITAVLLFYLPQARDWSWRAGILARKEQGFFVRSRLGYKLVKVVLGGMIKKKRHPYLHT